MLNHEKSTKIVALLIDYASLSETEARHFIKNMNQFIFASALQKRQMTEHWKQEGKLISDKK